jgi:hypothetical protein
MENKGKSEKVYRSRFYLMRPYIRALVKLVGLYILLPLYAVVVSSISGETLDPSIWHYALPLGIVGCILIAASEIRRPMARSQK